MSDIYVKLWSNNNNNGIMVTEIEHYGWEDEAARKRTGDMPTYDKINKQKLPMFYSSPEIS